MLLPLSIFPLSSFTFLRHDSNGETAFDGFGIRMRLGEFLSRTFDVCPHVFQLVTDALLEFQLLHIDGVIGVGRDGRIGVLLPCLGSRTLHADFEPVVLQQTLEVLRQPLLGDKRFDCRFDIRTEGLEGCFTFVGAHLSCEKLVNDRIIVCFHLSKVLCLALVGTAVRGYPRRQNFRVNKIVYCAFPSKDGAKVLLFEPILLTKC